jgi:hypothetical protein
MVSRNVVCFTSENLRKSSVTIRVLCTPTYRALRLGTVVMLF